MTLLRAELVTRSPGRDQWAELAAAWFTEIRTELFPEVDRGLREGARARLWVRHQPEPVGGSRARYSDQAWRRFLDSLATAYPYHAELLTEEPEWPHQGGGGVRIAADRNHAHPEWTTLSVRAPWREPEVRPRTAAREWAEFIKERVIRSGADYAHVTDDPELNGGTALEDATGRSTEITVPRCCEVLRGYSWVTVCAPELGERLGGADTLAASGAFDEVVGLPGGQVYLRATPALEDYYDEAVSRVFRALAPVLLTGRPRRGSSATRLGRLVRDADAADYQ
jgi:hypothetical protein